MRGKEWLLIGLAIGYGLGIFRFAFAMVRRPGEFRDELAEIREVEY